MGIWGTIPNKVTFGVELARGEEEQYSRQGNSRSEAGIMSRVQDDWEDHNVGVPGVRWENNTWRSSAKTVLMPK